MDPNTEEVLETHHETLHKFITKSLEEFRKLRDEKMKEKVPNSPIYGFQSQYLPKRGKNPVVVEQEISFTIDENPNFSSFDIGIMQHKLEKWTVQSRRRSKPKLCDTYYYHNTTNGRPLRSVTEIVNHILPEGYAKRPSQQKRNKKNNPGGDNSQPQEEVEGQVEQEPAVNNNQVAEMWFDLNLPASS